MSYPKPRASLKQRVLNRILVQDRGYATRCFVWTGEKDKSGYGRIKRNGRYIPAHWVLKGDPPVGLEPDHLCLQRDCVRPSHLEFVTHQENARRRTK